MSPRSKSWIKWLRRLQLTLRLLQLVAAFGILTLMILITKTDALEGWIMRITVRHVSTPSHTCYQLSLNMNPNSPVSRSCIVVIPSGICHAVPLTALLLPLPPINSSRA